MSYREAWAEGQIEVGTILDALDAAAAELAVTKEKLERVAFYVTVDDDGDGFICKEALDELDLWGAAQNG